MTATKEHKPDADQRWQIDRKIPLVLILTLGMNLTGGIWYAARLDGRIAAVETWTAANSGNASKLSALEAKLDVIKDLIFERKAAMR